MDRYECGICGAPVEFTSSYSFSVDVRSWCHNCGARFDGILATKKRVPRGTWETPKLYTDHAAAIHELREALVGLCGAYAAMAGRQNRPLSPFYAKARATLDKYGKGTR